MGAASGLGREPEPRGARSENLTSVSLYAAHRVGRIPPDAVGSSLHTAQMTTPTVAPEIDEIGEFIGTLVATPPAQLTNCRGWAVHDLTAHLAAGAAEQADLIEEHLAGKPARATRAFAEREPAYRALPDAELRDRLLYEATRFTTAQAELGDVSIAFTGRPMTASDFAMHGRSECTLHRWDIVGRDDVGWTLLGQPALTHHALSVLSTMSALTESPANRAVDLDVPDGLRVVVRSEPHDDLVITVADGVPTLTLEPITDAPAHLVLSPAARLLFLWGRREPSAAITLNATGAHLALLDRLIPVCN